MTETMWWVAVVSALIATDAALVWLGFAWHRRQGRVRSSAGPTPATQKLQAEFATLRNAIEGLDTCLTTVDRAIARSSAQVSARTAAPRTKADTAPRDSAQERSYAIAERLARKGADVNALMTDCGLSRGEAELIRNLHAPRPPRARHVA